jgi:hypothetical protein
VYVGATVELAAVDCCPCCVLVRAAGVEDRPPSNAPNPDRIAKEILRQHGPHLDIHRAAASGGMSAENALAYSAQFPDQPHSEPIICEHRHYDAPGPQLKQLSEK